MEIIKNDITTQFDCLDHFYPSICRNIFGNKTVKLDEFSTSYGYVKDGMMTVNGRRLMPGDYFSIPVYDEEETVVVTGSVAIFTRIGFLGQFTIGEVEEYGRVSYIDGCTDSILVLPPRLGDPCLNSLHFPPSVIQTFHTHPTIRLGVVAEGSGIASTTDGDKPLNTGDVFILPAHETHRFKTDDSSMIVVAYHPDSDWGPTDEQHPMLNRTYIIK